jgi:heme exporter protein CcmD
MTDGYGCYVWGAYALTFAALVGEVLLVLRRRTRATVSRQPGERSQVYKN